jgi:hypothetical protein
VCGLVWMDGLYLLRSGSWLRSLMEEKYKNNCHIMVMVGVQW